MEKYKNFDNFDSFENCEKMKKFQKVEKNVYLFKDMLVTFDNGIKYHR